MISVPAGEVGIVDYDERVKKVFENRKAYGRPIYIAKYLATQLLASLFGYHWLRTWWAVIIILIIGHCVFAIADYTYTTFKARGLEKKLALFRYVLDGNSLYPAKLEELGSRIVFLQFASLDAAKLPDLKYYEQFMELLNAHLRLYAESRGDSIVKQYKAGM